MMAITSALSALRRPSRAMSSPMVTKSEAWTSNGNVIVSQRPRRYPANLTRIVSMPTLDLYQVDAKSRLNHGQGYGTGAGPLFHQRRCRDARHAPADAPEVRAPRVDPALADDW